jgi:hypothetical protein
MGHRILQDFIQKCLVNESDSLIFFEAQGEGTMKERVWHQRKYHCGWYRPDLDRDRHQPVFTHLHASSPNFDFFTPSPGAWSIATPSHFCRQSVARILFPSSFGINSTGQWTRISRFSVIFFAFFCSHSELIVCSVTLIPHSVGRPSFV